MVTPGLRSYRNPVPLPVLTPRPVRPQLRPDGRPAAAIAQAPVTGGGGAQSIHRPAGAASARPLDPAKPGLLFYYSTTVHPSRTAPAVSIHLAASSPCAERAAATAARSVAPPPPRPQPTPDGPLARTSRGNAASPSLPHAPIVLNISQTRPQSPIWRHRIQDLELPDVLLSRHEHVHDRSSRHVG